MNPKPPLWEEDWREGHAYGNTVVRDGASAVLGDVNIGGDLHVHVHSQLDEIAAAGVVIQLVDTARSLSHIKDRLEEEVRLEIEACLTQRNGMGIESRENPRATGALVQALPTTLANLGDIRVQLHNHNTRLCSDLSNDSTFKRTIESAERDALSLAAATQCIRSVLDKKPAEPGSKWSEDHQITEEQRLGRDKRVHPFYTWLAKVRGTYLKLWDENIGEIVTSILNYTGMISHHLNNLLNSGGQFMTGKAAPSDIVEVLSMNKNLQHGLQPLGALLLRRNGEYITMNAPSFKRSTDDMQRDATMSVITYDLDHVTDSEHLETLSVQTVPNHVNKVKAALYFQKDMDRLIEVKKAHKKTFEWVFTCNDSPLQDWLRDSQGCFWISGKAGSGKSTLMKYIRNHETMSRLLQHWAGQRQLVEATFFFWYAGQPLQKSYEGVLRSLLHQILEVRPELTTVIFPAWSRRILSGKELLPDNDLKLSLRELQEAMSLAVEKLPEDVALFLTIDGLDEFDGEVFDFCKYLLELTNSHARIKLLVSSRPIPECSQVFDGRFSMRLQDLTTGDIHTYIREELLSSQLLIELDTLEPGISRDIETALVEKASGVFLWIVLVVRALLKSLRDYDERYVLMKLIDNLPNDLERLYDHMFANMSQKHQQQGSLLLQLVVRAREVQQHPLTALQLFIADKCNHHDSDFSALLQTTAEHDNLRIKAIEGKLRSKCCGLIEVQFQSPRGPLSEPRTDFLHRTVYDYLRDKDIWNKVHEIYDIETIDLDLRLLVANALSIKRLHGSSLYTQDDVAAERLAAALEYSHSLSCNHDLRYLSLLRIFDSKCHKCSPFSIAARDCYHEAYLEYVSKHRDVYPDSIKDLSNDAEINLPPEWTSLLVFARLNFPDYFAVKIKKDIEDGPSRSLLLKFMLYLFVDNKLPEVLARGYIRNIRALLRYGANPNESAKEFSQGAFLVFPDMTGHLHAPRKRQAIDHHADSDEEDYEICSDQLRLQLTGKTTPWEYWLRQDLTTLGQLHITIHLVASGACIKKIEYQDRNRMVDLEVLQKELLERLEICKNKGIWPVNIDSVSLNEHFSVEGLIQEGRIDRQKRRFSVTEERTNESKRLDRS